MIRLEPCRRLAGLKARNGEEEQGQEAGPECDTIRWRLGDTPLNNWVQTERRITHKVLDDTLVVRSAEAHLPSESRT